MNKMYNEGNFSYHDVALSAAMSKLRAPVIAFHVMNEVAD